jgi:CubicO group peptidase (beta-lactamase class C family)
VKWDEALYGDQLLSAESKATMWTEVILPNGEDTGYAFGWSVRPYRGLTSQSHGGQVAGFVANFFRLPEQEAAIIVFLNRYRVGSGRVRVAVLHTFMPSLGPIP